MKQLKIIIIIFLGVLPMGVFAQGKEKPQYDSVAVKGNCDMCKKNIEAAADLKGVKWAEWNQEKHLLFVKYLSSKISLDEIQKHIADAGYDTEKYKASETAYKKLHTCCQYER